MANTFTGYGATLHVPAAGMVSYFTTLYWYNFNNILSDAIEPQSVSVSTAEAELEIGQQLSLSATVTPGNATPNTVYWSTTDASVATVSGDGAVTAVATGECDILATCVDKLAICHVTVVNPRVTITLDTHEARLLPNHTLTLNASCAPIDVDLAVTSSNPGVAIPRLVNGSIIVVGVAEGTATITINAADGKGDPDTCIVTVYTELGDTNCDGYINIADVTDLIDYLINREETRINLNNADTDQNGSVNIADVTELIDYLLNGKWSWGHDPSDYVDLGLPSGTLWATCNVGANTPEDYGDYFAWGETTPKDYYNWDYYKWCNGSYSTLTKYCTIDYFGYNGIVDNKTDLEPEDDAAYVNWGENWRMPTLEQLEELLNNCTWTWTSQNGVNGQVVTGLNGCTMFLPAAGNRRSSSLNGAGSGYYWSRTLSSKSLTAYSFYFLRGGEYWGWNTFERYYGLTVRAVRVSNN